MSAASAVDRARPSSHSAIVPAVAFVLSYAAARFGIETFTEGSVLRLASALLPVIPFAFFLIAMVSGARQLDELQRRIQLEALAIGFLSFMLVLLMLGLLQMVVTLKPEDWSYRHVWALMPLFYFAGLVLAQRRYR